VALLLTNMHTTVDEKLGSEVITEILLMHYQCRTMEYSCKMMVTCFAQLLKDCQRPFIEVYFEDILRIMTHLLFRVTLKTLEAMDM
jgi:hypothetical protein